MHPIDDDDKRFQYVATAALNHEEVGKTCEEYQKIMCCMFKNERISCLNFKIQLKS